MDTYQEIRSEIDDLQARIDRLRARLDGIDPAGAADAPAMEPFDIPLDDIPDDAFFFIQKPKRESPVLSPLSVPEPVGQDAVEEQPAVPEPAPEKRRAPRSWMLSAPGPRIGNIVSGISLNDRVLCINSLFREDPVLFNSTVADLNKMNSIEEAEDYIEAHFPEWNLNSKVVVKFMMAVRRKLG